MSLRLDTSDLTGLLPRQPTISTDTESMRSVGPRPGQDRTVPKGHMLQSEDGTPLLLRRWLPDKAARAQLLLVHDYMDYGERYAMLAEALVPFGIGCHAVDLRGHGISAGTRGYVRTLADYSDDMQACLNALPPGPQFLLGVGHGGLSVLNFVTQRRPHLHGLITIEPAIGPGPPGPKWCARLLRFVGRLWPNAAVPAVLWPSIGFAQNAQAHNTPLPLDYRHMSYAFYKDVPRIQARLSKLERMLVPWLVIDDSEGLAASGVPAMPNFKLSGKRRFVHMRVAEARPRLRAGEADTALVDAVAQFVRRQTRKRRSDLSGQANQTPTSVWAAAPLSPEPNLLGEPEPWCAHLLPWPAPVPLSSTHHAQMPGAFPRS